MKFWENLKMALSSIWSNKMRSLLTMLGIIIGISAVITITTLGNTLSSTFSNTFQNLGASNLMEVIVAPDNPDEEPDVEDWITMDMIKGFLDKYPGEFYFGQDVQGGEGNLINSQKQTVNVSIMGGAEGTFDSWGVKMLSGRKISFRDSLEDRHTCVVSDVFVKQYFKNNEEPIGQEISLTVNESLPVEFTIVGVYKYNEMLQGMGTGNTKEEDIKTPMYIPYTIASELSGTSDYDEYLYYCIFTFDNSLTPSEAQSKMESYFNEQYEQIKGCGVRVVTNEQVMKVMSSAISILTVIISVIAALSLLVGGVGVMNIMLVSVTERTREIGIRKALGAKKSTIKSQFVTEAIIICLIGGIIGIIVGLLNGEIVAVIANSVIQSDPTYADLLGNVSISPSIGGIVISLIFSTLTGIFFGLYPAGKAAKMDPIDALRYE